MTVPNSSSFRDPSGFLFTIDGTLYRQINHSYRDEFESLMTSGLYHDLVKSSLLVPHEESTVPVSSASGWKVIRPERIPFVSYPYEWCFGQLKAAALHTLAVQQRALSYGMCLKDASAYNVVFDASARPLFIDTLSFARSEEGRPWVAYRQFCQHFLAPLALMSFCDARLSRMAALWIDGIPLGLASSLMPKRSWLSFAMVTHLHAHARMQDRYANAAPTRRKTPRLGKTGLNSLLEHLGSTVRRMRWPAPKTEWAEYYGATNYTDEAMREKASFISGCLDETRPSTVWDIGGNVGVFSRLASERGIRTICFDVDVAAVEANYSRVVREGSSNLLPLVLDLTNPSPAIGWANEERQSLAERGSADMAFALALIHHLVISNNVPFARVAQYFSTLSKSLIIEFVPKSDSQVQRLLASREDVFPSYDERTFVAEFSRFFHVDRSAGLPGSDRRLFLMSRRQN